MVTCVSNATNYKKCQCMEGESIPSSNPQTPCGNLVFWPNLQTYQPEMGFNNFKNKFQWVPHVNGEEPLEHDPRWSSLGDTIESAFSSIPLPLWSLEPQIISQWVPQLNGRWPLSCLGGGRNRQKCSLPTTLEIASAKDRVPVGLPLHVDPLEHDSRWRQPRV